MLSTVTYESCEHAMSKKSLIVSSLLVLVLLLLGGWYAYYRTHDLPFVILATGPMLGQHPELGDAATLYVIAVPEDIERVQAAITPESWSYNRLADQLQQMDFSQFVGALVVRQKGSSSSGGVTVHQVQRRGDQIWIDATLGERTSSGTADVVDPYQLIAISKVGTWDGPLRFKLISGGWLKREITEVTVTMP
jgi:hypothetical protein